jgi:hypothetical protein
MQQSTWARIQSNANESSRIRKTIAEEVDSEDATQACAMARMESRSSDRTSASDCTLTPRSVVGLECSCMSQVSGDGCVSTVRTGPQCETR